MLFRIVILPQEGEKEGKAQVFFVAKKTKKECVAYLERYIALDFSVVTVTSIANSQDSSVMWSQV